MPQTLDTVEHLHLKDVWLTIGTYDGVHLGHQQIIRNLVEQAHAANAQGVVLAFYPHPAVFFKRRPEASHLFTLAERTRILAEMGTDIIINHPFNAQVAATSGHDFIAGLKEHLGFTHLFVGHDFALGHGRDANVDGLRLLGEEFSYQVHVMPPFELDGKVISSSQIRAMLEEGRVEQAAAWLGRPYELSGRVVEGDGRGRTIGIPTANLEVPGEKLSPGYGVYACRATVGGRQWAAATSIGLRPTFDQPVMAAHVEAYLLDFTGDLYGQTIRLEFMHWLRGEEKFPGIKELIDQIQRDIQLTRELVPLGIKQKAG